ncbi:hypothetical protein IKQ26_06065 [bacterium]|nr:hypothetical protein [bacterium]
MTFSLLDGTTQMVLMGVFMYVFLIAIPQMMEKTAKNEKKYPIYSNVLQYS